MRGLCVFTFKAKIRLVGGGKRTTEADSLFLSQVLSPSHLVSPPMEEGVRQQTSQSCRSSQSDNTEKEEVRTACKPGSMATPTTSPKQARLLCQTLTLCYPPRFQPLLPSLAFHFSPAKCRSPAIGFL